MITQLLLFSFRFRWFDYRHNVMRKHYEHSPVCFSMARNTRWCLPCAQPCGMRWNHIVIYFNEIVRTLWHTIYCVISDPPAMTRCGGCKNETEKFICLLFESLTVIHLVRLFSIFRLFCRCFIAFQWRRKSFGNAAHASGSNSFSFYSITNSVCPEF